MFLINITAVAKSSRTHCGYWMDQFRRGMADFPTSASYRFRSSDPLCHIQAPLRALLHSKGNGNPGKLCVMCLEHIVMRSFSLCIHISQLEPLFSPLVRRPQLLIAGWYSSRPHFIKVVTIFPSQTNSFYSIQFYKPDLGQKSQSE